MASPAPRRMTLAEFLDWDDDTDTRYELIEGETVAMAPAAPAHARIVSNVDRAIGSRLTPPCIVLSGAGVARREWRHRFFVPDLVVTCAALSPGARYIEEPRLVIEVLSPSTRRQDRDLKLDAHREFPSVEEVLLVWSDQRRLQLWRRDGRRWIVEDVIGDADVRLASVDVDLGLGETYENVVFEDPPPEAGAPPG